MSGFRSTCKVFISVSVSSNCQQQGSHFCLQRTIMWTTSLMLWPLWLTLVFQLVQSTVVGDVPVVYCKPKLWEGGIWSLRITYTDQGVDVLEKTSLVGVDVIGQRIVTRETGTRNGQHFNVSYILYYPAKTLFTIQNGSCVAQVLTGNFSHHCQQNPDDKYMVEELFEWLGLMNVMKGPPVMTVGARGVTPEGVVYLFSSDQFGVAPIMEERNGVIDRVPTYKLDNYFNVTLGIKDPSIFTPPENCVKMD